MSRLRRRLASGFRSSCATVARSVDSLLETLRRGWRLPTRVVRLAALAGRLTVDRTAALWVIGCFDTSRGLVQSTSAVGNFADAPTRSWAYTGRRRMTVRELSIVELARRC